MLELIKNELRKHENTDLASEGAIDVIAGEIFTILQTALSFEIPADESDAARLEVMKVTYTPTLLHLFHGVAKELSRPEDAKTIEEAYNDILDTAQKRNNGTMLLALSQALVTLLITATEQSQEEEKPDEDNRVGV